MTRDTSYMIYLTRPQVKLWKRNDGTHNWDLYSTLPIFSSAVTSVAFQCESSDVSDRYDVLAVGLEDGNISIWSIDHQNSGSCRCVYNVPQK